MLPRNRWFVVLYIIIGISAPYICVEVEYNVAAIEDVKEFLQKCNSAHCADHGWCVLDNDQFTCKCHPGYYGTRCTEEYLINDYDCSGNGIAKWDAIQEKMKCICNPGFSEEDCKKDLLEEKKCNGNGEAKWDAIKEKAICVCNPGFGGEDCRENLLQKETCNGNGISKWSLSMEKVVCVCYPGFGEEDCSKNLLQERTCSGNGKSIWDAIEDSVVCACKPGFSGPDCSENLLKGNLCSANGIPKWDVIRDEAMCVCKPGFEGKDCSENLLERETCSGNGKPKWDANDEKVICVCNPGFAGKYCSNDLLQENTCSENGKPKWDAFEEKVKCICYPGFAEEDCSKNLLVRETCSGNGIPKWDEIEEKVVCVCNPGFDEKDCRKDMCKQKKCSSQGACRWDARHEVAICVCDSGYGGNLCDINLCEKEKCNGNGYCRWNEGLSIPECICQNGYTGPKCEADPCEGKLCSSHGMCKWNQTRNSVECDCEKDFVGDECQYPICEAESCNNRGVCIWKEATSEDECMCHVGYFGPYCEVDPCDRLNCGKNGKCEWIISESKAKCACFNGWTGNSCEKDPCQEKKCSDNGKCKWNNSTNAPECHCNRGYAGTECEQYPCKEKSCSGNGECDWNKEKNVVECVCNDGFGGPECENNHCEGRNCSHHGKCKWNEVSNLATCSCDRGFTGPECDTDLCENLSCIKGTCEFNSAGKEYCKCDKGFTGEKCSIDICEQLKCTENGKCVVVENGAVCQCFDGFAGEKCEKEFIDFCATNPCMNDGNCTTNGITYSCECDAHFEGKNCMESVWCKKNLGICGKAICKFDKRTGIGFCDCESEHKYFEKGECKTITKCTKMIIEGKCSGEHHLCANNECKCVENYKLDKNNSCIPNFCSKITCKSTEDCKELGEGNTICTCKDGYYFDGTKCKKVDPCSARTSKCQQKCIQKTGECRCFDSFSLNEDNFTCTRNSEETACNLDCGAGVCIKSEDTDTCVCPPATHLNIDNSCIDICTAKHLPREKCPQGRCIPDEKLGFICDCSNPLYKQATDGIHCERKLMCTEGDGDQECAKLSAKCVENPEDKTKGYRCVCDKGAEEDSNGICRNKCQLKKYRNVCEKLFADCVLNSDLEPICKCPPLLSRKYKNQPCSIIEKTSYTGALAIRKDRYVVTTKEQAEIIDEVKLTKELEKSLHHVYQNIKDTKLLHYTEDENGTLNCVVEMQLSAKLDKERVNQIASPSVCVSLDETYCWVKPYLVVKKVADGRIFRNTDACMSNVKERLCGSTTNCTSNAKKSFQCECKPGFESTGVYNPTNDINTFVQRCEDSDECLNPTYCPHRDSTKCVNTYGSYECQCKDGYRSDDDNDIEAKGCTPVCDPNPCVHGSCIQVGNHGFSCNCQGLFTGYLCNTTNEVVLRAKAAGQQQSSIVGGALGAVLLLIILIAYMLFKRNRKLSEGGKSKYQTQRQQAAITEMSRLAHRSPQVFEEEENIERVQDHSGGNEGQTGPVRIPRILNNDEDTSPDPQGRRRQQTRF